MIAELSSRASFPSFILVLRISLLVPSFAIVATVLAPSSPASLKLAVTAAKEALFLTRPSEYLSIASVAST